MCIGDATTGTPSRLPVIPFAMASAPENGSLVPLLLGDGYHRTVDIPAVARHFDCTVTRGLSGEHAVALALYDRLRAAERTADGPADAVVVAGAGSSRPGGNDGTLTAVRQLGTLLRRSGNRSPTIRAWPGWWWRGARAREREPRPYRVPCGEARQSL
ncbi:sirohydrochlorin chelatase [Streptomyces sp. NPDC055103]